MAKQVAMFTVMYLASPAASTLLGQHNLIFGPTHSHEIQTVSVNSEKKAIPVTIHESSKAWIKVSALQLMSVQRPG